MPLHFLCACKYHTTDKSQQPQPASVPALVSTPYGLPQAGRILGNFRNLLSRRSRVEAEQELKSLEATSIRRARLLRKHSQLGALKI